MIEQFFRQPATAQRHRAAPLVGPYLDDLVGQLAALGYARISVRRYLYAWLEFGRFAAERGIELRDLGEADVETFLHAVAGDRTWRGVRVDEAGAVHGRRRPLAFLLERLRDVGVVRPAVPGPARVEPAEARLLDAYLAFLRQHRGVGEAAVGQHALHVGRFLRYVEGRGATIRGLSARELDGFVVECGRWMTRRSMGRVSAALRGFLRYLHVCGEIERDLASQIAMPRVYRLETVPRALPWAEVGRLLAAPDRSTVAGRRDHAILVLLAVYGMRAGEVAALTLDDIDWRANELRIPRAKGGRASSYPLHPDAGAAVADYLRRGRPASAWREIFLTISAPARPFARSSGISNIVARHLLRAGIAAPHWGAHTLRHSRAVHLLGQGFSLAAIGDLFGHHHAQSTFIYAKAALEDLRPVGLEVTEFLS
jgi:integrase/recombinase XerD